MDTNPKIFLIMLIEVQYPESWILSKELLCPRKKLKLSSALYVLWCVSTARIWVGK